ncbi:hypothetical protein GCM10023259_066070 [Thermocatellispora tengchongensis]
MARGTRGPPHSAPHARTGQGHATGAQTERAASVWCAPGVPPLPRRSAGHLPRPDLRAGGVCGDPACDERAEGDVGQVGAFGGGVQAGHLQDVLDQAAECLDPSAYEVGHPARWQ